MLAVRADHRKNRQANRPEIQGKDWRKNFKKEKKPPNNQRNQSDDECSGTCTLDALFSIENSCVALSQVLMKIIQN